MTIVVIGGTPASGKTSLTHLLAAADTRGVHIETDRFFRFLAHRLDPSLPTAQQQNTTVIRAYVAAAIEYSAAGYSVYLEGVIGPWALLTVTALAANIQYVLLHAPLDVVLARSQTRAMQPSATAAVVTHMHQQFAKVVDEFRRHVIDTEYKTVEQVADEFFSRSATGAFQIG
ncbi:MAG: hypothetical protein JWM78_2840 [Verrucomicrobiaceae bacterium]|nr:hypothetical protein [Verrucomicrobiaceae bacterium]